MFLPYLDNFLIHCGIGMIESMLEPHLKQNAGATQTDVGIAFLIYGGVYMISSPIAGLVCMINLTSSRNSNYKRGYKLVIKHGRKYIFSLRYVIN